MNSVKFQEVNLNPIQSLKITNLLKEHSPYFIDFQNTCSIAVIIASMIVNNISDVFVNDNTYYFIKLDKTFGVRNGAKSNILFFRPKNLELIYGCKLKVMSVEPILLNKMQIINKNK